MSKDYAGAVALRSDEKEVPPDSLAILGSDWYWEQDADFRYISIVIPEHARARGVSDRVLGRLRWELPDCRALSTSWEQHRAGLRARQSFQDFQYVTTSLHDGLPRYMSSSGEPRFDAAGRFLGYRGTSRDITAQWQEKHRLREAETLLKMASRLGRFGGWSVELAERAQVSWSDEVCDIHEVPHGFRCSAEGCIGFYVPEHRARVTELFTRCVEDGVSFDVELQILTARGRRIWVRVIGEAQRDDEGRSVRVQGAFQDIDAMKALADERRRSADKLTATLDSLADGFFVLDRDARFSYLNPETARVLRRRSEDLLGRCIWDVFPQARGTRFEVEHRRAVRDRVTVEYVERFGPLDLWVRVRAWPTVEGLAVSFVDITAQKDAEAQLHTLNLQLEERVRQRTAELEATAGELKTLSYAIAHDVRAPLASISGFGQALEQVDGDKLSARGRQFLQRIRSAAVKMDAMTEGLLQLAQISREPPKWQEVDLSALAHDMWRMISAQEPARTVQVHIAGGLRAQGTPAQLALVLQNLLANAWKFTRLAPSAVVEFGAAGIEDGQRVFFVKDNGAGFDPACSGKLFTPFQRLHGPEEFAGTGLGLATVRKVIQLHGGRVWAESAVGRGATFFFALPATR